MNVILYIDDDRSYRMILSALLSSRGFAVEVARDGLEGVKKARELQPDMIFLDLCLRPIDGLEVLKQIQRCSLTWDIPVVLVSVFSADSSRLIVQLTGAQGYIAKPFRAEELIEAIQKHLPRCADASPPLWHPEFLTPHTEYRHPHCPPLPPGRGKRGDAEPN